MVRRKCNACGKEEKHLRIESGFLCKFCRLMAAPIKNKDVCWLRKACSKCGTEKLLKDFTRAAKTKDGRRADCSSCRFPNRIRRIGHVKQDHRLVHSWYDSKRRHAYTGALEEYADHWERIRMGCTALDAWDSWIPKPPKAPRLEPLPSELRIRATSLQRPVKNIKAGNLAWPMDWGDAERYAWRYENDLEFRAKEVLRIKIRKYTNPTYAGDSETDPGNKRKWNRAKHQLGKVTRRHIRRESYAPRCSYCLAPLTPETRQLDHIVPLSKGGLHDDGNIIVSCRSCNMSKGSKSLIEWLLTGAFESISNERKAA